MLAASFVAGLLIAAGPLFSRGSKADLDVRGFSRLPLLEGGRIKPIDSFARNSLLVIRGQQSLPVDKHRLTAAHWLLDSMFRPEAADTYKAFVIDDPDVLGLLGLERGKERRFAYWQVEPKREEIRAQAERSHRVESGRRSRFQTAVANLDSRLELYERIKNTVMVNGADDPVREFESFVKLLPSALKAMHGSAKASAADQKATKSLTEMLDRYRFLASAAAFKPLPPRAGEHPDEWTNVGEAAMSPAAAADPHPGLYAYARMAQAYKDSEPAAFNDALRAFEVWLRRERPEALSSARSEEIFNRAQPFVSGMTLYVMALLAVCLWWATRRAEVQSVSTGLLGAAVLVHTLGLCARVILQGRPPVTNLYSSAVFVGWVAALLGLFAERFHKKGFAAAGGALVGFCSLLVAHHLGSSGDTMEMMRAVLDSNFWLATHVVTITIGYGATFLAGALGVSWIVRLHFVKKHDAETSKALTGLTYGVIAFGLFWTFVGTVLGGIWADQSWGRFWGWDPKENGALLIVLWNAAILHARWTGAIRDRGIMVMAVLGNVVTSLSWFGVNMLGVGLHSYGFMDKAFWWLVAFAAGHFLIATLALLPPRFWTADKA
ncbi:MAG: cytochrome C assembly protein [Elusimicrobia bacterium RBG_16_66_12]|nr:MAG: cytochrome C assembly protein [Elusimicrobia bacterium RBG_16_66_12]